MTLVPLQTPGMPELIIIALNVAIFAVIVVGILTLVRRLSDRRERNARRIEELEERVSELEE